MNRLLHTTAVILFTCICCSPSLAQQQTLPSGPLQLQGMPQLLDSVKQIERYSQRLNNPQWEYLFLQRNKLQSIGPQLAQLGLDGWELVAVTDEEGFVLKRRKP